jgi:tRNA-2-methylthio-N6-dimethylallyladenosine synthase
MDIKYLYINTIGCQMNVYDSRQIACGLKSLGYIETKSPDKADLIILNTCSIREKAEEKAFSFLGRLATLKKKKPDLIIGVGGCVAQQEGRNIIKRVPFINIVFGTRAISRLPHLISRVESTNSRIVDVEMPDIMPETINEHSFEKDSHGHVSNFITIMRGCDNYCTYCVVPHVRGRETSRSPQNIIRDIRNFVKIGTKEVTLLGQNVNSFGKKENLCSFPELLSQVNDINGLSRIRFTTSHPKDFSDELMYAFKDLEKLCNHLHLPVQSGSNKILKRMNRKYTKELYIEKIEKLRKLRPDISVTSDMIVGFPGETDADFEETLGLMKTVGFDGLFAFIYSDRPNTKASEFSDKIPEEEKKERLQKLLDMQEAITRKKNRNHVGKIESILVEGMSKKQGNVIDKGINEIQWTGRTSTNKIVNFTNGHSQSKDTACIHSSKEEIATGMLIDVRIEKAFSHSLSGKAVTPGPLLNTYKGEKAYVA